MTDIAAAKALLEAEGYVVLKAKSYRQAQQRHAIHEREVYWAERAANHAREWARDCLGQERRSAERCTYLYVLAASHGATEAELRGPS